MFPKNSIIKALLNINPGEWPSIGLAWALRFFFHTGFIISWSILTAFFIARFGIDWLPLLFIINALLITSGTYYFSKLVRHFSAIQLMNFTVLTGAILLFIASLSHSFNSIFFVSLLLLTHAVFFAQLEISIFGFTEELFTPLEGERVFPIIESGEIIGGIVGGILISILANIFPAHQIIYFLIVCLFILACFIRFYANGTKELPRIYHRKSQKANSFRELQSIASKIRKTAFLRHMFFIVGIFWVVYYLIQFELMHFITEDVRATGVVGELLEAELTHKIGTLEAIFHSAGLIIQFFVASRVISSLGIVRSLVINPIFMILSAFATILSPTFIAAALLRNNLEIGGVIHLNSYHNSYYAVNHSSRGPVREFLEGYIRPLGAIVGMTAVVGLRLIVPIPQAIDIINILIIICGGLTLYTLMFAQKSYSQLARANLKDNHSSSTKLSAIEILLQKGHADEYRTLAVKDLIAILKSKTESTEVKIAAVEALAELKAAKSIAAIIKYLSHDSYELRSTAVRALQSFNSEDINGQVVNYLKQRVLTETQRRIRVAMIRVLIKVDSQDAAAFLVEALKSNPAHTADYIYSLGLLADPAHKRVLFQYLNSTDHFISANALVALWQFPETHKSLESKFQKILHPADKKSLETMLFVLARIRHPEAEKYLLPQLKAPTETIRFLAAYALASRSNPAAVVPYADLLCSANEKIHAEAHERLNKLPRSIRRQIWKTVNQHLSQEVRQVIKDEKVKFLEDLSPQGLLKLRHAYAVVDDHQALVDIDDLLS